MKVLLFNADDLGLSPGVNRGILESVDNGPVRSTSLLVNLPAAKDGARAAAERPDLGVGLHVNLLAGEPVLPAREVRSLTDGAGRFAPLRTLTLRALTAQLSERQLTAEIRAQAERAMEWGVSLTHFDSHRFSQVLPVVCRAMQAVMEEVGVSRARRARLPRTLASGEAGLQARLRRGFFNLAEPFTAVEGARGADHFALPNLLGLESDPEETLARAVRAAPEGVTEFMVHPGYADDALIATDPYTVARERELRALTRPALLNLIRESGARLGSYRDVEAA